MNLKYLLQKVIWFYILIILDILPELQAISLSNDTENPILLHHDDIEMLTTLVLYRSYMVLDAPSQINVKANVLDKFLDFLVIHKNSGGKIRPLFDHGIKERDLGCDTTPNDVKPLCNVVSSSCLPSIDLMNLIPQQRIQTLDAALVRLCPLFLFRQKRPLCEHPEHEEQVEQTQLSEPSVERVWGFSILFVTISIVVSMGGLTFLPFLKRDARKIILTLCEGLAVGGLTGSAVLHLFPQAFSIEHKFKIYFWKILLIFCGIYFFYLVEHLLKLYRLHKTRNNHRRRRQSFREDEQFVMQTIARNARNRLTASEKRLNEICIIDHRPRTASMSPNNYNRIIPLKSYNLNHQSSQNNILKAGEQSPKMKIDLYLASLTTPTKVLQENVVNDSHLSNNSFQPFSTRRSQQRANNFFQSEPQLETLYKSNYVKDIAGRRQDHDTMVRLPIDSVAWMIVLGDASLNFIDGLSIGAGFERNILAGISISVAVMLEEVTHRLGTFAVLIRAGMKMNQSFLWIFLSACAMYPGIVLGIILGDKTEYASPYIFAMAGGMFLYMALVDVMREMNRSVDNASRKSILNACKILALQNVGIIVSVFILSMLALFDDELDLMAVEIQEVNNNLIIDEVKNYNNID